MKKFFIIAGEASGDLLGSKLISEIKLQHTASEFIGVGGKLMQEQGLVSIFPMEELSVMGFLEVLPHLSKLLRRINQTAEIIVKEKPDFVISIDSPDFNFRVMKKLQNFNSAKKIHLIAPSVWAYRAGRAQKISKLYDLLLCVLPFEPAYFEKHGLKTVFIGHPLISNAPDFTKKEAENLKFRQKYLLKKDDIIIALTPGSRESEVQKIFPEFIGAVNLLAEKKPNLKVIIPLVEKTRELVYEMAKTLKVEYFPIEQEEKEMALFASDFALAKSGTNTLEFSLHSVPIIVAYKINCLTHFLFKMMVRIKFANLINLIMHEEIIPEMLQKNCDAKKISIVLKNLISDKKSCARQIEKSKIALKLMGFGSHENHIQKAVKAILAL
ncbi:MAG: lipid-A-disaccharide synthase [Alphaproteobacteria bacterium RIFCSPLOWO2_01_FULL_40_26]|nr:MAG: lipid-A-disaccharide synthase [Alphaproteobacteria bacterium RIFCSPHIGHO2_02_FULL_40_34]OFW88183.1 MAG: lipid-A-disaccharide synthase [Alphaproteobacteria bacterium RIFCSPHIGHO2_01_FULL_40_8]OFW95313.1 MAG: lipid-A-disaccharide synthase [Alphaproteobacteria bacterium RIFCSPLOWO2_01_FULL_40_26]OFX09216.1 MAG: lipid-A-disaccharide synthase [Alphaproteobacteria bacterium RIFCSPLOWO2_02_FULL_40_19]OFX11571.1 MAG: lipid-A-disaccharide synthase [Alphaproteobacteria bacterium RIFCSPLOWO2_12_FU